MMSGNFSFPPPPPPPPKASQDPSQGQYDEGRFRGHGGGRGYGHSHFDGRGRGRGRGRGNFTKRQQQLQNDSRPAPNSINGTPISNYPSSGSTPHPWSNPRTSAGHKRKLDALRPPSRERERKPAPEPAPAVPNFGLPLPPQESIPRNNLRPNTKTPNTRNLGLVPSSTQYESSSDSGDDVDEEAMFAELGTKLTFEHDGRVLSLNTPADIEAWKKERKRNFPTKARMSEREMEKDIIGKERRRLLDEATKLDQLPGWSVYGKMADNPLRVGESNESAKKSQAPTSTTQQTSGESRDGAGYINHRIVDAKRPTTTGQSLTVDVSREHLTHHIQGQSSKLEELRQQVEQDHLQVQDQALVRIHPRTPSYQPPEDVQVNIQPSSLDAVTSSGGVDATHGEKLERSDRTTTFDSARVPLADNISTLSHSSRSSTDSESDDSLSSEDSDDQTGPEETSSKPPEPLQTGKVRPPCRYYLASGYCRDGNACRFRHELPTRGSGAVARPIPKPRDDRPKGVRLPDVDGNAAARKGLYERLVEQEMDEENKLALEVVKYLGEKGFFAAGNEETEG